MECEEEIQADLVVYQKMRFQYFHYPKQHLQISHPMRSDDSIRAEKLPTTKLCHKKHSDIKRFKQINAQSRNQLVHARSRCC
jgi:hypothetical protein